MKNRLLAVLALVFVTASGAWALGAFPKVGEYEVLRGDFHMHTVNSDGKLTARQRIDEAKSRDLDVFAITDHGNFRASRFQLQYAPTQGLVPLRGMETGLEGGLKYHLVALGFDPLVKPKNSHRWSAAPDGKTAYYRDEMIKLRDAGAVLVLAHPGKDTMSEPIEWGIQQGIIQGVEVHNTRTFIPIGFDIALKYNLAVFANSDAHGAAAKDYTLVLAKERTSEGVKDAVRARRTVALYNDVFWGRQDMLSMLINAMVKVRTEEENGSRYAVFENVGPVPMKGVITGASEQPLEIAANSKARIPVSGGNTISVRWENAFVSSTEKLTSEFAVR